MSRWKQESDAHPAARTAHSLLHEQFRLKQQITERQVRHSILDSYRGTDERFLSSKAPWEKSCIRKLLNYWTTRIFSSRSLSNEMLTVKGVFFQGHGHRMLSSGIGSTNYNFKSRVLKIASKSNRYFAVQSCSNKYYAPSRSLPISLTAIFSWSEVYFYHHRSSFTERVWDVCYPWEQTTSRRHLNDRQQRKTRRYI
jgi:hypothetical protein